MRNYLPDLNVLIALVDPDHQHFQKAQDWFTSIGRNNWRLCSLTEAGFLRVTTNPAYRPKPHSFEQAIAILQTLKGRSDCLYWGTDKSWVDLTAPFAEQIRGHRQVTDAYLLGMAIEMNGKLVTFDKGIQYMAGAEFSQNVLLLE